MKTKSIYILFLVLGMASVNLYCQSTDQNYILTRTYTNETGTTYLDQIQYFDGLGRPVQTVQKAITPGIDPSARKDLILLQEYDSFGRESNAWLPAVIGGNNGAYVTPATVKTQSIATNGGDQKPYSMPVYETSPLNRVLKQFGPGQDWQDNGKAVSTGYLTSTAKTGTSLTIADSLVCGRYLAEDTRGSIIVSRSGNYAAGDLYVTRMKDEDGNISYEFKDKLGQVVLTRQINANTLLDTYYIYDSFGNLKMVLPPIASDMVSTDAAQLNSSSYVRLHLAYLYLYDNRNRCIGKKLPGCDWIYYVYDKADRLIFTQDGEQYNKSPKEWTFSIPDAFGRVVLTGTCTNNLDYSANPLANIVVKASYNTVRTNPSNSYTVTGVTLSTPTMLSVNFYDGYEFLGITGVPNTADTQYSTEAGYGVCYGDHQAANKYKNKGLQTGALTAQMKSDGSVDPVYLYSVMYYDDRGRVIQTKSNNHLAGGIEKEYIAYNFTGQPTQRKHVHSATGKNTQTEVYAYTYDHAGRLTKTTHQLTDGTTIKQPVTLAENDYDELGRLKTNIKGGQAYLNTTYGYNIRSWTNKIYSHNLEQDLSYKYNGNISTFNWRMNDQRRSYTYTYDNLSRLKTAAYTGIGSEQYSTEYGYDKHGNIMNLKRYGKKDASSYGEVDNLIMTYNGNQLAKVSDGVPNFAYIESADFKNYGGTNSAYTYNKNGAMSTDSHKGITKIQYNSLNLPYELLIKNTDVSGKIYYTYSASGVKLKTKHLKAKNLGYTPVTGTEGDSNFDVIGNTDYVGNMIYEDGLLKRILVDGGYIENSTYHYYLTDHLGNNRMTVNQNGVKTQWNHYYPFGMAFADKFDNGSKQPYKYNGKELDQMHGLNLYDYSARYYEPAIGQFTSVDPKAESYPWNSPYMYAGNNPILNLDLDGEDYWSTNDPELIKQFLNSVGRGGKYYDFTGWGHATDAVFISNLTYNDETGKFYTSYGTIENGVATIVGKSFDANLKPATLTGIGYSGAFVYEYGSKGGGLYMAGYNAAQLGELSVFAAEFMSPFDPNRYFDGTNNWEVDTSGRLTGVNNVQQAKKGGGGKALAKMFIKGFGNVSKDFFHKTLKPTILSAAGKGNFSKMVGTNPDITVVNGKIVLQGTGPGYKGKTFNTNLNANDFLQ